MPAGRPAGRLVVAKTIRRNLLPAVIVRRKLIVAPARRGRPLVPYDPHRCSRVSA